MTLHGPSLPDLLLWMGALGGVLSLTDWLLTDRQKAALRGYAAAAWIWLDDQRAGRFVRLLGHRPSQIALSLFAHVAMAAIVLLFLARVYLGWHINATFSIGFPRLHRWQVWVDVVALGVSAVFIATRVHPRIALEIAEAPSLPRYYGRAAKAWLKWLGLFMLGSVAVYAPAGVLLFRVMDAPDVELALRGLIESYLTVPGAVIVHAITALALAPSLVEMFTLQCILFLSVYWILLVWAVAAVALAIKAILLRIAEHPKGPVLALSALLAALGAIGKLATGPEPAIIPKDQVTSTPSPPGVARLLDNPSQAGGQRE